MAGSSAVVGPGMDPAVGLEGLAMRARPTVWDSLDTIVFADWSGRDDFGEGFEGRAIDNDAVEGVEVADSQ